MCATCGCDGVVHGHDHDHERVHGGDHDHDHDHGVSARRVKLEIDLLAKNDRLAAQNRAWLDERGIVAFNLMGAPGAGKTALLEAVLRKLTPRVPVAVLEGDQDTDRDAARIAATGAPVVQINTGAGCHLDAHMVQHGLEDLAPPAGSILFVENVGNLVCPAMFALGEHAKVVVMSVTEGDDKPLKYPHMFRGADVLVLNKIDLLEHVDFDVPRALGHARELAPNLRVFQVSARRGDGLDALCDWLAAHVVAVDPEEEAKLRSAGERIDELIEELGTMVGPQAWERLEELMHRTVSLYGAGIGRMLGHARATARDPRDLEARVCRDELVSSLLRLHGVHPVAAVERVKSAFEASAELVAQHGLAIEDVRVDQHDAHVRVAPVADASSCASSPQKALAAIERIVHEAAPELAHVQVEGMPEASGRLVQLGLGRSGGAQR